MVPAIILPVIITDRTDTPIMLGHIGGTDTGPVVIGGTIKVFLTPKA
jgi:hypothetical protein